ncbi:MAG: alpha-glucuronidase family glycosyl hydrolase [Chryseolinea sp.]
MIKVRWLFVLTPLAFFLVYQAAAQSKPNSRVKAEESAHFLIDFSGATIFSTENGKRILAKPIVVLADEIKKRTGITLQITSDIKLLAPAAGPLIIVATSEDFPALPTSIQSDLDRMAQIGKDGFKLLLQPDNKTIVITGRDERSVLYGVGRLLRKAQLRVGSILIDPSISISTTPVYAIRGHQLGYRPKTNSYDAFSVAQFDQYIRELALFGANSIEIVPPRTDDDPTSKHMKLAPIEMLSEQSRICKSYGLDVWMWYPNMGTDYRSEEAIAEELRERATVFAAVEKLDALFVPGGDPGELNPDVLFAWLEKQARVLHQYHPEAKIWVSPQVFRPTKKWMKDFYQYVNRQYDWFGGVVFGPWIKTPIDSMRAIINPAIPIRMYPDITHSLSSQYPVPDWDLAYAMTLGRECINPRPRDEKHIHNLFAPYGTGSISYSEGTNDDVNKFIWSDQDWNPNTTVEETLRDYARLFIDPEEASSIATGIIELEENLRGPLLDNRQVNRTLTHFQLLEKRASSSMQQNFRFQMCLIRAYYDAFIQQRLIRETKLERDAYQVLKTAPHTGSVAAITEALKILKRANDPAPYDSYKSKCHMLADSLFKSIGAQLTLKKHGAVDGRGNFIDNIDVPLNDAPWIIDQLSNIAPGSETETLEIIEAMLHRTDPGKGGIYTNFGTPSAKQYVVQGMGWSKDPGGLQTPMVNFGVGTKEDEWVHEIRPRGFSGQIVPKAWMTQHGTLYETPLMIRYTSLNPKRSYQIRLAYTGRLRSRTKLTANGYIVHDYLQTGDQPIYTFDIPKEALSTGEVTLKFVCPEGEQGAQVSEIWIVRKSRN